MTAVERLFQVCKMIRFVFLLSVFVSSLFSEEYTFRGKHFVASYIDCDLRSMCDLDGLVKAMDEAVSASGAMILDQASYVFPPNGITLVYLLSESHASLHTYPEHGACFVDLFTCGDHCSAEKFDEVLRKYLQPRRVNGRTFLRSEEVQEICPEKQ
jgi:S-adenosylmethionine decarboxylase